MACIEVILEVTVVRSLSNTYRRLLLLDITLWMSNFPFNKKPKASSSSQQELTIEIKFEKLQNIFPKMF